MQVFSRVLYNSSRWLHIYLSTALFSLLLFFCASGLVLNNMHWLDDTGTESQLEVELPQDWDWQNQDLPVLMPKISIWLSKEYNLPHPRSVEFDPDFGEIIVDYSLPAGGALATILVHEQSLLLEYQQNHWMNIWTDLHKGRHSGTVWSWVLDISAVLMLLFAVTGFVILFQNRKKRGPGVFTAVAGTLTPFIIYLLFVPFVST